MVTLHHLGDFRRYDVPGRACVLGSRRYDPRQDDCLRDQRAYRTAPTCYRPGRERRRAIHLEQLDRGIHRVDTGAIGPKLAIVYGVHGNERSPIDAGESLLAELRDRTFQLERGVLTLIHGNPRATEDNGRASNHGVDLNRCFHESGLAAEPSTYEERRAREIVAQLDDAVDILVDFHCTVEPAERFLMHHPSVSNEAHRATTRWLAARILIADPSLRFGAVSLDEWMSTRGRVGICYETGWMNDPANTGDAVLAEMKNLVVGLGLAGGEASAHDDKTFLELDEALTCDASGFRWADDVGKNLQAVPQGTALGEYGNGQVVTLDRDATLIFPKKRPELVEIGKPFVYLATRCS